MPIPTRRSSGGGGDERGQHDPPDTTGAGILSDGNPPLRQRAQWRPTRTLSQAELGRRTHDSGALIGKIEKGERFPSLALAHRLDGILDTGGVDMAQQAHSLGDATQALELVSAGLNHGSPLTAARCAAWQGRVYAVLDDHRACAQACSVAQRALDRAAPVGERLWFKFFTADHLNYEMLRMASDLGNHDDVQRLAPDVLASSSAAGLARRRVLGTTALARSYLPAAGNPHSDIDHACDLLGQMIPLLGSLRSTHSLDQVNSLRRALALHARRPSVRELGERFRSTIPAPSTPV